MINKHWHKVSKTVVLFIKCQKPGGLTSKSFYLHLLINHVNQQLTSTRTHVLGVCCTVKCFNRVNFISMANSKELEFIMPCQSFAKIRRLAAHKKIVFFYHFLFSELSILKTTRQSMYKIKRQNWMAQNPCLQTSKNNYNNSAHHNISAEKKFNCLNIDYQD